MLRTLPAGDIESIAQGIFGLGMTGVGGLFALGGAGTAGYRMLRD